MSLRMRILLLVGIAILVLALLSATVIPGVIVPRFEEIETRLARDHGQRALRAVQDEFGDLEAIAGDWGAWDDSREFMSGRAPDFLKRNLNPETLATLDLDFMVFLRPDGQVFRAAGKDPSRPALPKGLQAHIVHYASLRTGTETLRHWHCAVRYAGGGALVASSAITDSQHHADPVGLLVVGRLLDREWLVSLSERLQETVSMARSGDPQLTEELRAVGMKTIPRNQTAVVPVSLTQLSIWTHLPSECPEKSSEVFLRMVMQRDISAYGRASARIAFWAAMGVGGVALLVLWLVLDFLLLRPLSALVGRIRQLETSQDFSQRVPENGRDELSAVAHGINRLLASQEDAHLQLRRSEKRLRAILDTVQTGILVIDSETHQILEANPVAARLIGAHSHEIVGHRCHKFVCPHEGSDCPADNAEGHVLNISERVLVRWDGSEIPVLKTVVPIRLNGRDCYLESFVDLRERKQAEEERRSLETRLAQVEKMESLHVMAGSIAHNFNNMLQAVLGNHDLLRLDLEEGSTQRDCLEAADVAARRAAELSALMLTYVGQGGINVSKTDMASLCEDMKAPLRASLPDTVRMDFEIAADLPALRGDAAQLRQMIDQLARNAIEAVENVEGGSVGIAVGARHCSGVYLRQTFLYENQPAGDYVYVEVSDNGCGMSRETANRAFDPYFTTKFAGRGLGLASVLGIVRGHHGALTVYSEPGHGTRIKALFPVRPDPAEERKRPGKPLRAKPADVLVVDDDARVRAVARDVLHQLGLGALCVPNGDDAISALHERARMDETPPIVCVLLDLILPGVTGDVVLERIREAAPDLPVILASGYHVEELAQRFRDAGFDGFIQKPFDLEPLRDALDAVLNR